MAGVEGFEPPRGGVKIRCLTAWRYPNMGTSENRSGRILWKVLRVSNRSEPPTSVWANSMPFSYRREGGPLGRRRFRISPACNRSFFRRIPPDRPPPRIRAYGPIRSESAKLGRWQGRKEGRPGTRETRSDPVSVSWREGLGNKAYCIILSKKIKNSPAGTGEFSSSRRGGYSALLPSDSEEASPSPPCPALPASVEFWALE